MTNPNALEATTLTVTLAVTHVDGGQPSMAEVLAWLNRCVNCNPNHARVEIQSEPVVATAAAEAAVSVSSDVLGPMSDEQYLARKGIHCPACHGTNLTGNHVEINGGTAYQPVYCSDCKAQWNDLYSLTGYADLESGVDFEAVQSILDDIASRRARHDFRIDSEAQAREVISESSDVLDVKLSDGEIEVAVRQLLA